MLIYQMGDNRVRKTLISGGLSHTKEKEGRKVKEIKVLIDSGKGEILLMSNNDEKIKAAMYEQLVDGGHEFEEDLYERGNWGEFDFEIYKYSPTVKDDVVIGIHDFDVVEDKSRSDVSSNKLHEKNSNIELAMEVLKKAMIGSKPQDIVQNYLFKAFSLLQNYETGEVEIVRKDESDIAKEIESKFYEFIHICARYDKTAIAGFTGYGKHYISFDGEEIPVMVLQGKINEIVNEELQLERERKWKED